MDHLNKKTEKHQNSAFHTVDSDAFTTKQKNIQINISNEKMKEKQKNTSLSVEHSLFNTKPLLRDIFTNRLKKSNYTNVKSMNIDDLSNQLNVESEYLVDVFEYRRQLDKNHISKLATALQITVDELEDCLREQILDGEYMANSVKEHGKFEFASQTEKNARDAFAILMSQYWNKLSKNVESDLPLQEIIENWKKEFLETSIDDKLSYLKSAGTIYTFPYTCFVFDQVFSCWVEIYEEEQQYVVVLEDFNKHLSLNLKEFYIKPLVENIMKPMGLIPSEEMIPEAGTAFPTVKFLVRSSGSENDNERYLELNIIDQKAVLTPVVGGN